jgi:hypothetical protein
MRTAVSLLMLAVLTAIPHWAMGQQPTVKPLVRAHAHNDYEHARPLFDALERGFCSVEADIWLTPDGILIAHDRNDLKPGRTLQSLYLDPLRERIQAQGGRVYRGGPTFSLLVDVKSEAVATYAALDRVLQAYGEMLTTFSGEGIEEKAVTVVLSGNRDSETIARQARRLVGIDARPEDLERNPPRELYPWVSGNWTLLYRWRGEGAMPADEKQRLSSYVRKAHEQGRQVRFWATPESPALWRELARVGVDYINTDRLDELKAFLSDEK